VDDSVEGLVENQSEVAYLNRYGGGTGTNFSAVRSIGERTSTGNETTGVIRFIKVLDSTILAFQQGATRRGAGAIYLDVSHPEIEEFIEIRKPTGDEQRRSRYLHNAVNITDAFMEAVVNDEDWHLIDPHSKRVRKTVKARDVWKKILVTRMETGEPYLHFIDTSNKALPLALKLRGLRINGSNLCNEIYLPTAPDRTAVCCLSSVNLEKFDEWKDNELFIEDLIRMLDNVLDVFIQKAPKSLWRAINSAKKERSVGLGAMGFHGYLQSKGVSFESAIAAGINRNIFQKIYHEAKAASGLLAKERGEPEDMVGTGYRNAHVLAIAPNASSSYICGNVSPGIEPLSRNAFTAKVADGTFEVRNIHLMKVLDKYGKNNDTTWQYIALNGGSVESLTFLTDQERDVFKTAIELDQRWLVEHAGIRQPFIDQGQSVNLFFKPDVDPNYFSNVHFLAWKKGLKGLYYCRSVELKKAMTVGTSGLAKEVNKVEITINNNDGGCLACEG
jgi:ribonucleoside-diphosphate reductase alpha chain